MKTVKEISDLAGISVRTLHYYDEIGLVKPTEKSEAGYRLYDDKAIEILEQVLLFREFDIPLKQIKAVIDNPSLGRKQILAMQRKMLVARKERMERLIANIDKILKGENAMDLEVFSKSELAEMYSSMESRMSEEQKAVFIKNYGSMEAWKKYFLESAGSEAAQKNFQKAAEWYGGKEKALEAAQNPAGLETFSDQQKRMDAVIKKLAGMQGGDVNSPGVREMVGEYELLTKQMFRLPDAAGMLLEMASAYQTSAELQAAQDKIYGEGAAGFIGRAIEAFYKK